MRTRLDLDKTLREIIGNGNVYFQPPENLKMNYPCIRYSLYDIQALHGDNLPYIKSPEYQLILIDPNPDNEFVGKLAQRGYLGIVKISIRRRHQFFKVGFRHIVGEEAQKFKAQFRIRQIFPSRIKL